MLISGETLISPIVITITLICGVLIVVLPRKYALMPFIFIALYVPVSQRLVFFTIDLYMIRLLILFAILRIIVFSEYKTFILNRIDILMVLWAIIGTIAYSLLRKEVGALVNRLGFFFTVLGIYFTIRILVKDYNEFVSIIKMFLILSIPLSIAMLYEKYTTKNYFSIFGGVPEFTMIRDGRLRCQGAFLHPIMAGTFAASLIPIYFSFLKNRTSGYILSVLGIFASLIIVYTSSSSGPFITLISGLFILFLWPLRQYLRLMQISSLFLIILLQLVMSAPIWFITARVKVFSASTGYHRAMLIDSFIKNFGEWWLLGTRSTADWGHYGLNLWDVTNQFIRIAVDGGLLSLLIFLTILILCFINIGRTLRLTEGYFTLNIIIWSLGASLFSHIISFMGVSYFDQIIVWFYTHIALISSIPNFFNINNQQSEII